MTILVSQICVLLERNGLVNNEKQLCGVYLEEGLAVPRRRGRRRALGRRTSMPVTLRPSQRWSFDFLSDIFGDNRKFRIRL